MTAADTDRRSVLDWRATLGAAFLALTLVALLFVVLYANGTAAAPSAPAACPTGTLLVPQTFTVTADLQRPNAPPPDPSWAVPVTLTLYPPGDAATVCHQWELVLDESGRWTGHLDAFTGLYDARIKNIHTLRNVRRDVTISETNSIDAGTLREGDANNDNRVQLLDFGILRNAYGTSAGGADFDVRTDFDEDGSIDIRDFGLLRLNYGDEGDIEVAAAGTRSLRVAPMRVAQGVTISVEPPTTTLEVGAEGAVTVTVHAGTEQVVGADFALQFDPGYLEALDAFPGEEGVQVEPVGPFDSVMINTVQTLTDSARIRYGAGTFESPASGSFPLAVVHLEALAPTDRTELTFESGDVIDPFGVSVIDGFVEGAVTVMGELEKRYLPLVLRQS